MILGSGKLWIIIIYSTKYIRYISLTVLQHKLFEKCKHLKLSILIRADAQVVHDAAGPMNETRVRLL